MKVKISNKSNKKRSLKAKNELKAFAFKIAKDLGVLQHIDVLQLNYTTKLIYYKENQPLYGFKKLFHNRCVQIDFAQNWDLSQATRKTTIIHELTHVKQMVDRKMLINRNCNAIKWNGKIYNGWKKFRWKTLLSLEGEERDQYLMKTLPWEKEVHKNIDKLLK